jgi:hypothetical protein
MVKGVAEMRVAEIRMLTRKAEEEMEKQTVARISNLNQKLMRKLNLNLLQN